MVKCHTEVQQLLPNLLSAIPVFGQDLVGVKTTKHISYYWKALVSMLFKKGSKKISNRVNIFLFHTHFLAMLVGFIDGDGCIFIIKLLRVIKN